MTNTTKTETRFRATLAGNVHEFSTLSAAQARADKWIRRQLFPVESEQHPFIVRQDDGATTEVWVRRDGQWSNIAAVKEAA